MEIMNHGEKHIACVLLVDISGSMSGQPMEELNRGLQEFAQALQEDDKAYGCADVCVISFASQVRTVVPFCAAADYQAPPAVRRRSDCPERGDHHRTGRRGDAQAGV